MFLAIAFLLMPMIPIACSWSNHAWKKQIDGGFFSVFSLDKDHVWATGIEGRVEYYDGSDWELQQSGAGFLNDITASDLNNVWATDFSGRIHRSDGSQWDVEYESGERLHCINAGDDRNVWAGGEEGGIYHYDGRGWSERVELGEAILDMDSTDPGHVWAVGGRYYESQESTRPEGPGHVYSYDGKSWSERYESEEMLYGVSVLDENHVWVVGAEGSIFFYDGNGWSRLESPTTYALVAVSAADPEHVWTITQFGGLVLFYDGSDWAVQHRFELEEGEEGIIELSDIYAVDKDNVWLVGSGGFYSR
jgi:photosystem II stability/assembly factor-like uncharacterized protein